MKYTTVEKKIQVSSQIKEYAEKKAAKLEKYFRGEVEAFITFSNERSKQKAEITIENNGMFYRASELSDDMRSSIDTCCGNIERQIRKNKTRLEKKLREGAFEREIVDAPEEPEETVFDLVRTKRFPIKYATVDEAILQMNLLEHEFFAFKNGDADGAYSVVYRRHDGGYGLIIDEK